MGRTEVPVGQVEEEERKKKEEEERKKGEHEEAATPAHESADAGTGPYYFLVTWRVSGYITGKAFLMIALASCKGEGIGSVDKNLRSSILTLNFSHKPCMVNTCRL